MILTKARVQLLNTSHAQPERFIEVCGKVCYKSENTISADSARAFCKMLISKGHETVLEHISMTMRIICDRGISHCIVRHRMGSYSQESTMYCNYSKGRFDNNITYIVPPWINIATGCYSMDDMINYTGEDLKWYNLMLSAEQQYMNMIKNGYTPSQARVILPHSLKTEIIVTYNLRELRHFIKLRLSKNENPQMREVAKMIFDIASSYAPICFEDLR